MSDTFDDYWWGQRVDAAIFTEHDDGKHTKFRKDCPDCQNEKQANDAEKAIANAERLARGE